MSHLWEMLLWSPPAQWHILFFSFFFLPASACCFSFFLPSTRFEILNCDKNLCPLDCMVAVADVGLLCWESWKRRMGGEIESQMESRWAFVLLGFPAITNVRWNVTLLTILRAALVIPKKKSVTFRSYFCPQYFQYYLHWPLPFFSAAFKTLLSRCLLRPCWLIRWTGADKFWHIVTRSRQ